MGESEQAGEVARCHFFIPPDRDALLRSLGNSVSGTHPDLRDVAEAFLENLRAVLATASMPFHLASTSVHQRRWEKVFIAERIRARKYEDQGKSPEYAHDRALESAKQKFAGELASPEMVRRLAEEVLSYLAGLSGKDEMRSSAAELLRQSTVLTWGALEVLANDVFIRLANVMPKLCAALLSDDRTRRRFQLRDPMKVLERHDYDVSRRMGDIMAECCRLDDVGTIRAVYDVLIPESVGLRGALGQDALWILYQRRNLIVHRRGVVDEAFISRTGDRFPLGAELVVTPRRLREDLELARDIGCLMLGGATGVLRPANEHPAPPPAER